MKHTKSSSSTTSSPAILSPKSHTKRKIAHKPFRPSHLAKRTWIFLLNIFHPDSVPPKRATSSSRLVHRSRPASTRNTSRGTSALPHKSPKNFNMAESFTPSDRPVDLPSNSPSDTKKKRREVRYGEARYRVTTENMVKKAELAQEGINVRDFAEEVIEREEVKRNRRADGDQSLHHERGEDEHEKRVQETLERELEADEK
ncbi:hypothetical protein GJ744_001604 [Endocarpon pusillum]|uniref:Uncharacterized protein n=1 Tax=Endocarpon pusillum TaxID=364733 RepID=A0A8H7E1Q8_9EURO|nr:hypothetical protein GJ744_001604 [Endocarpon pusillum]